MKISIWMLNVLLCVLPAVVWSGPNEEAEAKQSFDDFKAIYTKPNVTNGELKDALALVLKSNELNPGNFRYTYSAAATYDGLGEYDQAVEWYRKAADIALTDKQRVNAEIAASESRFMLVALRKQDEPSLGHEISVSMMLKGIKYEPELREGQRLPTLFPYNVDPNAHLDYLEDRFKQYQPFKNTNFLIVSYESHRASRQHYERGVKDFYTYFQNHIFGYTQHRPVVLFLGDYPESLIDLTNKLYPELRFKSGHPFMGYFNKRDNVIFATVMGGYGTLLHEMIHALIFADFPEAPGWLEEAFATIYERTKWQNNRLIPLPNWRLDGMNFEEVSPLDLYEKYKGDIKLDHRDLARLRLFYTYIDELGQLKAFYQAVKASKGEVSVAQIAKDLGVEQAAWSDFAERSFIAYQIDLAKDSGRTVNPAETRFIQRALNAVMDAGLKEDGLWGNATEVELKRFQSSQGLKPDGIYGKNTRTTLQRLFAEKMMD